MPMKNIFGYQDYRAYLNDFYRARKERARGYSYRQFSLAAGIDSPNYLKMVIDGRRPLVGEMIFKFGKALGFGFEEHQWFEALVQLAHASSADEKKFHQHKLARLKRHRPEQRAVSDAALVARWYYPAILVSVDGLPVVSAVDDLSGKLRIPKSETQKVISLLKDRDAIREGNGKLAINESYFQLIDRKASMDNMKRFLREQMHLSSVALGKYYERDGKFLAHTFTVREGSLPFYADKMKTFLEDLTAQSNAEPAERLVQLNMQMFPLPV